MTWHLVRKEYLCVVVARDFQSEYIETLERADSGDLAPFVRFLIRLEKGTLLRGLALFRGVEVVAEWPSGFPLSRE